MPYWWQIATSSAAGALITLIGVFVGSALTGRTQRRLWNRTKQIDTCATILAEATRISHALAAKWRRGTAIEWVTWNQALAAVWLIGEPEVVEKALSIDKTFWIQNDRVNRGEITDDATWNPALDAMDADRLEFVNAVRTHIVNSSKLLTMVPTGRTVLSETRSRPEARETAENERPS